MSDGSVCPLQHTDIGSLQRTKRCQHTNILTGRHSPRADWLHPRGLRWGWREKGENNPQPTKQQLKGPRGEPEIGNNWLRRTQWAKPKKKQKIQDQQKSNQSTESWKQQPKTAHKRTQNKKNIWQKHQAKTKYKRAEETKRGSKSPTKVDTTSYQNSWNTQTGNLSTSTVAEKQHRTIS